MNINSVVALVRAHLVAKRPPPPPRVLARHSLGAWGRTSSVAVAWSAWAHDGGHQEFHFGSSPVPKRPRLSHFLPSMWRCIRQLDDLKLELVHRRRELVARFLP